MEHGLGMPVDLPASLARRALQIAYDPGCSIDDAAEHLLRLAKGRQLPLRLALAHLRRDRDSEAVGSVCEHACVLLRQAVALVRAPASLSA